MTYNKIYNQLEKNGLIEKLMVLSNYDKIGIIKGIKYLETFLNSYTFNNMKYWNNDKNTISLVCVEYANLQILNNKKYIEKFEYMKNQMEN